MVDMLSGSRLLRVDRDTRAVFVGDQRLAVRLSRNEFELLAYLHDHAGQVCGREELRNAVWGTLDVGDAELPASDDHMLHALVYRVRTKIRDVGVDLNAYLVSVPGVGYRFDASGSSGDDAMRPPNRRQPPFHTWRSRLALGGGVLIVLLGIAALGLAATRDGGDGGSAPIVADSPTGTPAPSSEPVLCGAELLEPDPAEPIDTSDVRFRWTEGCGVDRYDLWVGCSLDADDFYNPDDGYFHEASVHGIPLDGGPVYVRLSSSDGTDEGLFIRQFEFTTAHEGEATAVIVPADAGWFDTGIDLGPDQSLHLESCGHVAINSLNLPRFKVEGDAECPSVWRPALLAPDLPCWSLVARVGDGDPFMPGASFDSAGGLEGRLYLAVNDDNYEDNSRGFRVSVTVTEGP